MAFKKLFIFGNAKRTKLVAKVDTDPGDTKPGKKGVIIGGLQDSPTGVGVRITFDDAGNVVARVQMDQLPAIGLSPVPSFMSTPAGPPEVDSTVAKSANQSGFIPPTRGSKGTSIVCLHLSPQPCPSNAPVNLNTASSATIAVGMPAWPESWKVEPASSGVDPAPVALPEEFTEFPAAVRPHDAHQSPSVTRIATEESVPVHGSSDNSPTSKSSAPISEGSTLVSVDLSPAIEVTAKAALIGSLEAVCATPSDVLTGNELVIAHQDQINEDASAPPLVADCKTLDGAISTFNPVNENAADLTLTSSSVSFEEIALSSTTDLSPRVLLRPANVAINSSTTPPSLQAQSVVPASIPAVSSCTLSASKYGLTTADFRIGMSLGEGGQGSVSLVAYRADARLYALKAIKKRTENAHRRSENAWVFQEQDIMRRLARRVSGCPFFVELLASFEDERNLYLVTDAYEGGDLQDAIYTSDLKKLTVGEARPIAAQIILGMQALHGLRIIHRDIKPANIFLDKQDNVRIGDFGLACAFGRTYAEQPWLGKPHGYYLLEPERTEAEQDGDPREDTATRQCGTREYMAPEMCRGDPYSYEVDVWAFGMVVYEMLHGKRPFGLRGPREQVLDSEYRDEIWVRVCVDPVAVDAELSDEARDLLVKILDKDARNRPSWEQIQAHPWFDGLDWDQLANPTPLPAVEVPKDAVFHKQLEDKVFGAPSPTSIETYPFFQWTSPEFTEFQRTASPEAHIRVPFRELEPAVVSLLNRCPPEPLSPAKFPISPIADDETAALASPDAHIAMDIDGVIEGMLLVQENPENLTHRNDCFAFDVPRTPLLGFEQSFPEGLCVEDALFDEDGMDTTCLVDVPLSDEDPVCGGQSGEGLLLVNKPPSLSAFYGAFGVVVADVDIEAPAAPSRSERNLSSNSTAAPGAVDTLDGSANESSSSSSTDLSPAEVEDFFLSARLTVDDNRAWASHPSSSEVTTSLKLLDGLNLESSDTLDTPAVDAFCSSEASYGDKALVSSSGDSRSDAITGPVVSPRSSSPGATLSGCLGSSLATSSSIDISDVEVFTWSISLGNASTTIPAIEDLGTTCSWSSSSSRGSSSSSFCSVAMDDSQIPQHCRLATAAASSFVSGSSPVTPLGRGEKPTWLNRVKSWWSSLWVGAARRTTTRRADFI